MDCPECGAEIYFDSEKCPRCGVWIYEEFKGRRAEVIRGSHGKAPNRFVSLGTWTILVALAVLFSLTLILLIVTAVR